MLAPLRNERLPTVVPGQYIVVFRPGTPRQAVLAAEEKTRALGGTIGFTYTSALNGFSGRLPPKALAAVRATAGVDYVEADQKVTMETAQLNPPQGLDRTSERLLPLDHRYTYSETGTGVHVYVVDSGIRASHAEFAALTFGNSVDLVAPTMPDTNDCGNGHGTFSAAIIGGANVGIAKNVTLHAVRVFDCTGNSLNSIIAGAADWVTMNSIKPAVVNMSLSTASSPSVDFAVNAAITAGNVVVAAAGNQRASACTRSPAAVPAVITVGAIDPATDALWVNPSVSTFGSNFGTCVDLFAPGFNILSASIASNTATATDQGTSFAAPHVAGVAALYLQNHPMATPTAVWAAIHAADDVTGVLNWGGVGNLPANTVNELLHWGSQNDGYNDGDPHITTVDGVQYDFQPAGEFVALRDGSGLQVQTRQTPVATAGDLPPNAYTGLATCVSLNTAVAARVGAHRITYQPNLSGVPDPTGLQLRIDGVLTTPGPQGIDLGPDGRVVKDPTGLEIDFADGTILLATPGWWATQGQWYLDLSVLRTRAAEGVMGALAPASWLPALPNGTSLGARPPARHDRHVALNQTFADAWRVTPATSLFDYAPGTSTATFTLKGWPMESPPCAVAGSTPVTPATSAVAQRACAGITDKDRREECVFDVRALGNTGFAKTYLQGQKRRAASTATTLTGEKDATQVGEWAAFTAVVTPVGTPTAPARARAPAGTVQFTLDGANVGDPVQLDARGRATWETSRMKDGTHHVAAIYLPSKAGPFRGSASVAKAHTVTRCSCEADRR